MNEGLNLQDVAVARGGRRILAGVTLAVAPGDAVLVKGANGAGKTTLLRAIAGLLAPEKGTIAADGETRAMERRARIIYAGHANAVKAALNVEENLRFWAALYGAAATDLDGALEAMALTELRTRRAGALSAGQRRRLGLARLLLSKKKYWLLDEPAASIDRSSVSRLIELIGNHCADGGAALIATHDKLDLPGARTVVVEEAQ